VDGDVEGAAPHFLKVLVYISIISAWEG
jgi:hypothetical protein